jgi:hypothetical protein
MYRRSGSPNREGGVGREFESEHSKLLPRPDLPADLYHTYTKVSFAIYDRTRTAADLLNDASSSSHSD